MAAAVARAPHLRAGQRVRVSVEEGQVVIRPIADTALSLEQRLARFDPARHGGEVMAGLPVGGGAVVAAKDSATARRRPWVPDRQDIIWINCNLQVGREMRDIHPFLVLSPRIFNAKTSLVIGLPMSTAEYNADNPFAVAVGQAKGRKAGQTGYVLCHQPKSFDWRLRRAAPHPMKHLSDALFTQVSECLNQIIRLAWTASP